MSGDMPLNLKAIRSPRVPKLALTYREAGESLGLSPRSIEELVRSGQLRPVRVGRRVILPIAGLQRWLESEMAAGADGDQS